MSTMSLLGKIPIGVRHNHDNYTGSCNHTTSEISLSCMEVVYNCETCGTKCEAGHDQSQKSLLAWRRSIADALNQSRNTR